MENNNTISTEMLEKATEEKNKLAIKAAEMSNETDEVIPVDTVDKTDNRQLENSDIFITENDRFEVKISYYKDKNKDNILVVESVDADFDAKNQEIKTFTITFKYPSQGDYEAIISSGTNHSLEKMRYADILQMELFRIAILMRSWSLPQEVNKIIELDPNIVKAIVNKVREKIALKGIL